MKWKPSFGTFSGHGSSRLEIFGTSEFFLAFVKGPKALRLHLECRGHMEGVESPNAQL